MKKFILIMVLGSALFTGGAIYDGIDNQDMTQPTIHFGKKNPMKLNLYAKANVRIMCLIELDKMAI